MHIFSFSKHRLHQQLAFIRSNTLFLCLRNLLCSGLFLFSASLFLSSTSSAADHTNVAAKTNNQKTKTVESEHKLLLNKQELAQILSHGPWPPKIKPDPSNRLSAKQDAINFGKALFFSTELSADNTMSCASCHAIESAFSSGQFIKKNPKALDRNTLSLFNTRFNRWFGWDGSTDNLWAQSMLPILNKKEMN